MASKMYKSMATGLDEAVAFMKGEAKGLRVYNPLGDEIRTLRHKLGLSQQAFSQRYGFNVATLREWEQGRRVPDLTARTLLKVIEHSPKAVQAAVAKASVTKTAARARASRRVKVPT